MLVHEPVHTPYIGMRQIVQMKIDEVFGSNALQHPRRITKKHI